MGYTAAFLSVLFFGKERKPRYPLEPARTAGFLFFDTPQFFLPDTEYTIQVQNTQRCLQKSQGQSFEVNTFHLQDRAG